MLGRDASIGVCTHVFDKWTVSISRWHGSRDTSPRVRGTSGMVVSTLVADMQRQLSWTKWYFHAKAGGSGFFSL